MNAYEMSHEGSSAKHSVLNPNGVEMSQTNHEKYQETIRNNKLRMKKRCQAAALRSDIAKMLTLF